MVRRAGRFFATAATALLLLASLSLAPTAAADDAADAGAPLAVTITAVSEPVVDPGEADTVVELRGTIENTSHEAIRYLNVNFWAAPEPITTSVQLGTVVASDATNPLGRRIPPHSEESGHVQVLTQEERFEPRQQVDFVVSATVGELELAPDPAAYLVGVHVRGVPDSGGNQTLGRSRVLLTASPDPLPAAAVVELSATPSLAANGEFVDDSLTRALGERLVPLLEAAQGFDATVLLDPLLLAEVDVLAQPHVVAGEERGPHEPAAVWAEDVRRLIDTGRVMRLPFGDLDVARAAATDRLEMLLDWAAAESATAPDVAELPLAVDLGERGSRALVMQLSKAGVGRVFVSNAEGYGSGTGGVVRTTPLDAPGLRSSEDSEIQRLMRQWAEDVVAPSPRVHLVGTTDDVAQLARLGEHRRWRSVPRTAGSVLFRDAAVPRPWETWSAEFDQLLAQEEFARDLTESDRTPLTRRVLLRSASEGFATEEAALAWIDAHPSLALDPSQVRISAAGSFVMGSRTSNFPVTLSNELPVPVTVRIAFTSEFPQRIDVPPTDFVTVQPGENLTLNVAPEAAANGVARVEARLETTGGDTFGEVAVVEITANEFGRVGWIIIVVSGAVVLGGTVMRIRAVQREQSEENSDNAGQ